MRHERAWMQLPTLVKPVPRGQKSARARVHSWLRRHVAVHNEKGWETGMVGARTVPPILSHLPPCLRINQVRVFRKEALHRVPQHHQVAYVQSFKPQGVAHDLPVTKCEVRLKSEGAITPRSNHSHMPILIIWMPDLCIW